MNILHRSFLDDLGAVFKKHNVRLCESSEDGRIFFEFTVESIQPMRFIAYYNGEFKGVTAPFNYKPEEIGNEEKRTL